MAAHHGGWQPGGVRGREPQSWITTLLSSIALAVLLFLSTFLPQDTSGVVAGGRVRWEEAAPTPARAAKPPHIVVVIVGASGAWVGLGGGFIGRSRRDFF